MKEMYVFTNLQTQMCCREHKSCLLQLDTNIPTWKQKKMFFLNVNFTSYVELFARKSGIFFDQMYKQF